MKVVLTVIAVNLTILTIGQLDFVSKAYANEPLNKNELLQNVNYGLVPLNEDGSITVKVNNTMDVIVKEVDTYAFSYCTVPVKVKNTVPVEIENQPIQVSSY